MQKNTETSKRVFAARTAAFVMGLLFLASASVGITLDAQPQTNLPVRWVVGLHSAPPDDPGDRLFGAAVISTNPVLRFVLVETLDPAAFLAAASLDPNVRYLEPETTAEALFTPDDPRFGEQYGPQRVRAPEAWNTTLGNPTASVCIVDTGIRHTHQEFTGRYLGGYDFVNDDADPWDDHEFGHGTHVAGIAAAGVDDGLGVAGIGNVGIRAAKVLDAQGRGTSTDIASGIQWCADQAVGVISLSLGGLWPSRASGDALQHAWESGSLIVVAAGNDGPCADCVRYPAKYRQAIAVGCTDWNDTFCAFSSRGPEVEVSAPGLSVLGTGNANDSAYLKMSGTSMSAPHVSGAAALVWSAAPHLTNCELRQLLRGNATDLGDPGWDPVFGHGRLDVKATLDAALAGVRPTASCEDPSVRILSPADGAIVQPVERARVSASSLSSDLRVELRFHFGPWIDITENRNGDEYYYDWNSTIESPSWNWWHTPIHARAVLPGRVAADGVTVIVLGTGLAYNPTTGPVMDNTFVQCVLASDPLPPCLDVG